MDKSSAAQIRSQAVENVDARHGYTVEFSSTPGQHAAEYDEEEARLTAAEEAFDLQDKARLHGC